MNEVEKRFLVQEIKNLVASSCVKECKREDLTVINPLKVAKNKEKMRMILDFRYINKHLRSCRFKYEDLRTAIDLFEKDGYFSSGIIKVAIIILTYYQNTRSTLVLAWK